MNSSASARHGVSKSKRLVHWPPPRETWDLQQTLGGPAGTQAPPAAHSVKATHTRRDAQSTPTAEELTAKCKSETQLQILLHLQAGAGKSLASQGDRLQCVKGGELRDPLPYMSLMSKHLSWDSQSTTRQRELEVAPALQEHAGLPLSSLQPQ